jgi:hypothetical protein
MNISTSEKIETIVLCYLQNGTTTGTMGTLVEFDPRRYRVVADGKTFIVWSDAIGWNVTFKGFRGIDRELYIAAANAFDGGRGRDISTIEQALVQ